MQHGKEDIEGDGAVIDYKTIEQCFIKKDFAQSLQLSYQYLVRLSDKETTRVFIDDMLDDALPYLYHSCSQKVSSEAPSRCACIKPLSILLQSLYELKRPHEIEQFAFHFYSCVEAFPFEIIFLCVNLQISEGRLHDAMNTLISYLRAQRSKIESLRKLKAHTITFEKNYKRLLELLIFKVLTPLREDSTVNELISSDTVLSEADKKLIERGFIHHCNLRDSHPELETLEKKGGESDENDNTESSPTANNNSTDTSPATSLVKAKPTNHILHLFYSKVVKSILPARHALHYLKLFSSFAAVIAAIGVVMKLRQARAPTSPVKRRNVNNQSWLWMSLTELFESIVSSYVPNRSVR